MSILSRIAAVLALIIAAMPAARPAFAQGVQCAGWAQVRMYLAEKHGEAVVGAGISSDGTLVVVTASPDGATWTMLGVTPSGVACLAAEGRDWTGATAPTAPAIPGGTLN
jgi:hypothetical protein